MDSKTFVDLASNILLGGATCGLFVCAYQQWRTSEMQRRQGLFELRYEKILKKYRDFLANIYPTLHLMDWNGQPKENKTEHLDYLRNFLEVWNKYKYFLSKKDRLKLDKMYEQVSSMATEIFKDKEFKNDELRMHFIKLLEKHINCVINTMEDYLSIEDVSLWRESLQKIFTIPGLGGIVQKFIKQASSESVKDAKSQTGR